MSTTIAQLLVKVSGDSTALRKDLREADRDVKDFDRTQGQTTSKMGKLWGAAAIGAAAGLGAMAVGARKAIDDASDLNESVNKAKVTFGAAAKTMPGFGSSAAKSLGMSRAAALDNAAGLGAMTQAMGLSKAESAAMSKRMLQSAADLASFHNGDPTDMLDRLRAGLSGESEPLKKFGILVSDARVKQEAYRLGIAKTGAQLTDAQKLQARYSLILRDGAVANNDFKNTSGGLANQQRILKAQVTDLSASLGKVLLPAAQGVVSAMVSMVDWGSRNQTTLKVLFAIVGGLATAILTIVGVMKAWAIAQGILNVVMAANPIVLVAAALIGLGVALTVAYKNSETFRNIVDGVFSMLTGVVGGFIDFFTKDLPGAFNAVVGWVKGNWPVIATIISGPFAPLVALATDAFGVRSGLVGAFNWLKSNIGAAAGGVSGAIKKGIEAVTWGFAGLLQERIVQPISDKLDDLLQWGKNIAGRVVKGMTDFVWGMADLIDLKVVGPIRTAVSTIGDQGEAMARGFINGIKGLGEKVWNEGLDKFKGFINSIIGFLNRIPFIPDIKKLAGGDVVRRPTMALIGEAGPEAVIPLSQSRKGRTARLLAEAAAASGLEGDFMGVNQVPRFADGALFNLTAAQMAQAGGAAMQVSIMRARASQGWGDQIVGWTRKKFADLMSSIPYPQIDGWVGTIASGVRSAALSWIEGVRDKKEEMLPGQILDSMAWQDAQMGKPYVWGSGHGGWNYGLAGYDCSGFSSHGAKKAGASLGAPGTTMTLSPVSTRTANGGLPMLFGFRGMGSSDPRRQHMGLKTLGTWRQFGNPGHAGGTDAQWDYLAVPPGMPSKMGGVGRFGRSQAVLAHRGEALLPPAEAEAWRRGGVPPVQLTVDARGAVMLADSYETAERLARIVQPALERLVTFNR